MGFGRFDRNEYASYSTKASSMSTKDLFARGSSRAVTQSKQVINAVDIPFRECRDSVENPVSCPILIGLDVTGSMHAIPRQMIQGSLGVLMSELIDREPVGDPHLLFMGIGDAVVGDEAPLQATQFETTAQQMTAQLGDLYLEGGGGGNEFESYDLAWAFAGMRTKTDHWEKRGAKGYVFTIGDEEFPHSSDRAYMKAVFKEDCPQAPTPEGLLEQARERYNVFHVIVEQGGRMRSNATRIINGWRQRLQKRVLLLDNYDYIGEVIVAAIAVNEGMDVDAAIGMFQGPASATVRRALTSQ